MFYKDNTKKRLIEVMQRVDPNFKPRLNEKLNIGLNEELNVGLNEENRPLHQIAQEIYDDWGRNVNYAAKPYLEAMSTLDSVNDNYYMDSGKSIVLYFLSNASTWRGETAKRIKIELKKMVGLKENITNEDFDQSTEEFIPHGSYTVSNAGGYEIMLNDAGDAARVRDAFGSDNPETSDWLEIEYVPSEDTEEEFEPVIDPKGYNIPLNLVMRLREDKNNPVISEESTVYPKEQLMGDFSKYAQEHNIDKKIWSDVYSVWYKNDINSYNDLIIMMNRLTGVNEEGNKYKYPDNAKTLEKLLNTAEEEGYITSHERIAEYISVAAKETATEFDNLHPNEQDVFWDSYYKKFLKKIGKIK